MARFPEDSLRARGEESLTEALGLDPDNPLALVYRAAVRAELGDAEGARADLDAYDVATEEIRAAGDEDLLADIDQLIAELDLRERLA